MLFTVNIKRQRIRFRCRFACFYYINDLYFCTVSRVPAFCIARALQLRQRYAFYR